jgi:amino acid transporter
MRSGLILAIFGFVGFESAASLGSEAVNPLVTIPRAIMSTAWISGVFFVLAAYAETIGFAGHETQLAQSEAPLQLLAELRHLPFLAPLITLTTVCSFFACALACITAAARILYKLSCDDHVHRFCRSVHPQHRTPHVAIFCVSTSMLVIIVLMTSFHVLPFDVYGWAGTFATYGFITAYFMVSAGSIVILSRTHAFTPVALFSLAGSFSILTLAAAGSFEESSGPYHWLPYIYIALIAGVVQLVLLRQRRRSGRMPSAPAEGTELSPGLQSD